MTEVVVRGERGGGGFARLVEGVNGEWGRGEGGGTFQEFSLEINQYFLDIIRLHGQPASWKSLFPQNL